MKAPFAIAALLLAASASAQPLHLQMNTEHTPPSSMMVDGEVSGFATEKMRIMLKRAGISSTFMMMPWKRAFALAQAQKDTCVYSTTRTPEREPQFKWVGPTHANDWTLFGRADRKLKLNDIDDARGHRIGAYNGDVRGEYLIAEGFNVDVVQNNVSNPRKLMNDRIDLWVTSLRIGTTLSAEEGFAGKLVPLLTFKRTDLYLACHPSVPDAVIRNLNAILVAMNKDGTSGAIEKKFDYWEPQPRKNAR
jgi:polar amino acid transport system substrate-binding protein